MITNPIGKTEGAGVGGYIVLPCPSPEKFLEIRFIDSCFD
jgi:hypothetical protein